MNDKNKNKNKLAFIVALASTALVTLPTPGAKAQTSLILADMLAHERELENAAGSAASTSRWIAVEIERIRAGGSRVIAPDYTITPRLLADLARQKYPFPGCAPAPVKAIDSRIVSIGPSTGATFVGASFVSLRMNGCPLHATARVDFSLTASRDGPPHFAADGYIVFWSGPAPTPSPSIPFWP